MLNTQKQERIPPHNLEAEKSVLGSMLIDENAVVVCINVLNDTSFYRTAHQLIFNAMKTLFERTEAIDIITVSEVLRQNAHLDNIGGGEYLTSLVDMVVTAANAEHYANMVRNKSMLRELIKVSSKTIEESFKDQEDSQSVLDKAEQKVFEIRQKNTKQGFIALSGMVEDSIETIEKICNQDGDVSGLSTGFKKLDKKLSGLHKGALVIVAGRPSMGKTSFALNIAQYIGLEKKVPVGIFSLEMSSQQILLRMLCGEAQVESHRVRDGYVGSQEWAALTAAAGRIKESKVFIDDSPNITPLEMKARARRLKAEHSDLGLIVIDYIQLMSNPGRGNESRQQEISYISRSLKIMAKEIDIPVIALSQLSRAPEQRGGDSRPRLSDIRESGAIEQDADVVLFLYRPSYYQKPDEITEDGQNIAEVIIGKQRDGPTGVIEMLFQEEYTRFRDLIQKQEF
ncbi:replicative DNA helicase [Elusimicrobiota bacterium]